MEPAFGSFPYIEKACLWVPSYFPDRQVFLIISSNKKIVLSHTSFVFACLEKQWSLCFIIYVQCWHVFKAKSCYLRTFKVCIVYRNVTNKTDDAYIHCFHPSFVTHQYKKVGSLVSSLWPHLKLYYLISSHWEFVSFI